MGKLVNTNQHRGHHEGHFRLRKDGRWECQFTLPNGKSKSVYGKSRPEVRVKMEEALNSARKGIDLKGERQTLVAFLESWFAEVVIQKNRPRTIVSYRSNLDVHILPALGHITLRELTPQDVQRFLNQKSKTALSPPLRPIPAGDPARRACPGRALGIRRMQRRRPGDSPSAEATRD